MNTAKQQIIQFITTHFTAVKGIYLFGSQADRTVHSESDYDIAFLLEKPKAIDPVKLFNLKADLARILGADVDLVDLQTAKTDFRFVIISTAERIFCSDLYFCEFFEMTTYSMYQRLEEERKYIIEDIKKRGTIYG